MKTKWTELITVPIAGLGYHDYKDNLVKRGTRIYLFHERSNQHDPQAIVIKTSKGVKLGYIPRNVTYVLHSAKTHGCKFWGMINQVFPNNPSWLRVYVKVKVLKPETETIEVKL